MNPGEAPEFTGELPKEIADRSGRATLLGQITVKEGSTFTGHVNVQVGPPHCCACRLPVNSMHVTNRTVFDQWLALFCRGSR